MKTNIVVVSGNLTRDAELKYTQTGTAIARLSLAWNQRKKEGDKWVDVGNFFDCTYMGKGAEAIHKYLTKGKPVVVSGELHQERWTDKEGQPRSKVVIFCQSVELGGSGTGGGTAQAEPEKYQDDIPF